MKLARHLANTTGPHLKTLREAGNVAWVLGEDSMAAGESVEPLQAEKVNKKVQSSESQSTQKLHQILSRTTPSDSVTTP